MILVSIIAPKINNNTKEILAKSISNENPFGVVSNIEHSDTQKRFVNFFTYYFFFLFNITFLNITETKGKENKF